MPRRGTLRWIAVGALALVGCSVSVDDLTQGTASSSVSSSASATSSSTGAGASGGGGATSGGGGAGGEMVPPGLVAAWHFDETVGTVAKDWTGHGHDATLALGASFMNDGQSGGAVEFHGTDYAAVDTLTGNKLGQSGTLSLWFRYSFPPNEMGGRGIFDDYDDTRGHVFIRRAPQAADYEFQAALQIPMQYAFVVGFNVQPETWKHVVISWDEVSQSGTVYIDGVQLSKKSYDYPFQLSYQDFRFGIGFEGEIDEVRLYDRALSKDEAQALP